MLEHKIKKLVAVCILLASTTPYVAAQGNLTKIEHKVTVGFQTGMATTYYNKGIILSERTRNAESQYKRLLFRISMYARLKVETGLTLNIFRDPIFTNKLNSSISLMNAPYQLSIPLTIQYSLLSSQSKVRPYFGAGLQYNIINRKDAGRYNPEVLTQPDLTPGTKYINIIFTQGVIFEINTKIQVTQSIHFIPDNGFKTLGIDLGIGYTLP